MRTWEWIGKMRGREEIIVYPQFRPSFRTIILLVSLQYDTDIYDEIILRWIQRMPGGPIETVF